MVFHYGEVRSRLEKIAAAFRENPFCVFEPGEECCFERERFQPLKFKIVVNKDREEFGHEFQQHINLQLYRDNIPSVRLIRMNSEYTLGNKVRYSFKLDGERGIPTDDYATCTLLVMQKLPGMIKDFYQKKVKR